MIYSKAMGIYKIAKKTTKTPVIALGKKEFEARFGTTQAIACECFDSIITDKDGTRYTIRKKKNEESIHY